MNKHLFRRLAAAALAVVMAVCSLSVGAFADEFAAPESESDYRVINAQRDDGLLELDKYGSNTDRAESSEPQYADDEIVTVIVQLKEPSVLDYYTGDAPMAVSDEELLSNPVSEFVTSEFADRISDSLLGSQQSVLNQINAIAGSYGKNAVQGDIMTVAAPVPQVQLIANITRIINGMTLKMPYGMLESVKNLPSVKRAYVEHTYSVPIEPVGDEKYAGDATYSYDFVNVAGAWEKGYTGKGMVVAVLDTGLDLQFSAYWDPDAPDDPNDNLEGGANVVKIRHVHEAFTEESFKSDNPGSFIRYNSNSMVDTLEKYQDYLISSAARPGTEQAMYKNLKVPYAFDYADMDLNVFPGFENAAYGSDHGTHVSGTILGYAETEEGEVKFSGIAPDAQLFSMKVANDQAQITTSALIYALNDALILGADVMNLSLGSDNGFSIDDTAEPEIFEQLEKAGITVMVSAGNSGSSISSALQSEYGLTVGNEAYSFAQNPEISMVGSPAAYDSTISVASLNNSVNNGYYLVWNDGETDHDVEYADANLGTTMQIMDFFGSDGNWQFVDCGYGTVEDFQNAGFATSWSDGVTGIALVQRGGIDPVTNEPMTFTSKISNAASYRASNYYGGGYVGCLMLLVYDNVEGSLVNMAQPENSYYGGVLPNAFISKADGEAILASIESATLKHVETSGRIVKWEYNEDNLNNPGKMSSFSSFGATPALELKPDVTAPGGNIYSTLFDTQRNWDSEIGTYYDYEGSYGMMSGTSMASPHMAGIGALVKEYVKTSLRGKVQVGDRASVAEKLIISTAVPQRNDSGEAYASPRQQGAGLADVEAAVKSAAYISVDGQKVGKLELGDDPNWTGVFPYSFNVTNVSDSPVTYNATIITQTAKSVNIEGIDLMCEDDVILSETAISPVTVAPGATVTVSGEIKLTADEIAKLKAVFTNGIYIEGFIRLEDEANAVPSIGLPFLGFLGDWTAAPIFDSATWLNFTDEDGNPTEAYYNSMWGISIAGFFDGYGFYDFAQNPYSSETQDHYYEENIYLAPGTGIYQAVNDFTFYQLRDAKIVVFAVRDKNTGEYYESTAYSCMPKTVVQMLSTGSVPYPWLVNLDYGWAGTKYVTDENGDILVDEDGYPILEYLDDGTECVFDVIAFGDGDYPMVYDENYGYTIIDLSQIYLDDTDTWPTFNNHKMDMTGDTISFDITIDTTAPQLENGAVTVYTNEEGRRILKGTFTDAGSLATVQIVPIVKRTYMYGGESEIAADSSSAFSVDLIFDPKVQAYTFEADITEYEHVSTSPWEYFTYEWTGEIAIASGDYAGNESVYRISVDDSTDDEGELMLATTSAIIAKGTSFALNVIDNTGIEGELTRVSSAPEIASIDANGIVTGNNAGTAVITVSKGDKSATCIVTVRDVVNGITSFEFPVDHYSTLYPNVYFDINLMDIQPYDMAVDPSTVRHEYLGATYDDYNHVWIYEVENGEVGFYTLQMTSDPTTYQIYFMTNTLTGPPAGTKGTATLRTYIGDVYRDLVIDWEIPEGEYLIPGSSYNSVVKYINVTESTDLEARYNPSNTHETYDVALYTAVGANDYSSTNPTTPATGLKLEGMPFCYPSSTWTGKLVNEEGYALPEDIIVSYTTSYGTEYYKQSYQYTYDSTTGDITIETGYLSDNNKIIVRADGVSSPGTPAGEYHEITGERPEGAYGPFTWTIEGGKAADAAETALNMFGIMPMAIGDIVADSEWGTLTETQRGVNFTPKKPGVVFIKAQSKTNPAISLNFVVVVEGIAADTSQLSAVMLGETPDLDQDLMKNRRIVLDEGEARTVTLKFAEGVDETAYDDLFWTCFDPDVAYIEGDMKSNTLYAVKGGATIITLAKKSTGEIVLQLEVYVNEPDITVSVNGTVVGAEAAMELVEYTTGTVTVNCIDRVYDALKWESSDPTVATVAEAEAASIALPELIDRVYTVSALKAGTADLTLYRDSTPIFVLHVTVTNHTHKYDESYKYDDGWHWQVCTICGEAGTKNIHSLVDGVCTVCGYKDINAHVHSYVLHSDYSGHWYECTGCGISEAKQAHTFVNSVCTVCGYSLIAAHQHQFYLRRNSEYHWYACIGCNMTYGMERHSFAGGLCEICGAIDPDYTETEDVPDEEFEVVETPQEGRVTADEAEEVI